MNDLDITLDRLADGELNRDECAALLASLDREDEGWKKCALALLESQTLRTELRGVISAPSTPPKIDTPGNSAAASPVRHFQTHWAQALAVAACLGLAFWLGRGSLTPSNDSMAVVEPRAGEAAPEPERSHQGRLTLVLDGPDGRPREMELPVVDGSYVDPYAVLSRSMVIPPNVLEAIERSGHKIERRREFMRQSVDAEHEVVVPIDRLRVVPVSSPMY